MHKKLLLTLVTAVFLLSLALTGCQGGISQDLYDQVAAQFDEAQDRINEARDNIDTMEAERDAFLAELDEAKSKVGELEGVQAIVAELEGQISALIEQYEMVGATTAETVESIVRYYSETHVYEEGVYDCNNMAADVWNILKKQGINAVIAVGHNAVPVAEITLTNHAWVLAEVAPGEYLALETTGGGVVTRSENALYYEGWYFVTPKEFNEYMVMIELHNTLAAEDRDVIEEHNQSTNQAAAEKLEAVHDKLQELMDRQEEKLQAIPRVADLINK